MASFKSLPLELIEKIIEMTIEDSMKSFIELYDPSPLLIYL